MSLAAWLRLTLVPGIGGETQRNLLSTFGLPETIFTASRSAVCSVIGDRAADRLLDTDCTAQIDAALRWTEQPGCHLLTLADAQYPKGLLEIPDPPCLLYIRGQPDLFAKPGLAIVGSRNATPAGCQTAEAFGRALADGGLSIISGMALGIDAAAHRGALDGNGVTIAVIGTGADRIYPARNRELALDIAARGIILSEFPLGTPALAANFPRRNRLISGLARGVLVVEAALQSGSLITARLAGDQGREVFAIPGSIHSPLSRGCHQLIKQGAKLVETATDILEELGLSFTPANHQASGENDDPLLAALTYDPISFDLLLSRSGLPADQLAARLLELELAGELAPLPGNRFQRLQIRQD